MTLRDIPDFMVLCMDSSCIGALNAALAQKWSSFYMNPQIRLMTLNKSFREIPLSTKFQLTVSPSNSDGRLDREFDDAISKHFCLPHHPYETLTKAAQRVFYEKWRGFAPPGTCMLVPFSQELGKNDWVCQGGHLFHDEASGHRHLGPRGHLRVCLELVLPGRRVESRPVCGSD